MSGLTIECKLNRHPVFIPCADLAAAIPARILLSQLTGPKKSGIFLKPNLQLNPYCPRQRPTTVGVVRTQQQDQTPPPTPPPVATKVGDGEVSSANQDKVAENVHGKGSSIKLRLAS
ncbi:hypothetical protein V6N13_149353 [Hibiscus sabdariffa]